MEQLNPFEIEKQIAIENMTNDQNLQSITDLWFTENGYLKCVKD
jgi:hypothetical protein